MGFISSETKYSTYWVGRNNNNNKGDELVSGHVINLWNLFDHFGPPSKHYPKKEGDA